MYLRLATGEVSWINRIAALGVELEVALPEGADHAVFSGGAGIDGQRHTRTRYIVVAIAVLLAEVAIPCRCTVIPPLKVVSARR